MWGNCRLTPTPLHKLTPVTTSLRSDIIALIARVSQAMLDHAIAASAAAARAIGYVGLGDLIQADELGPEQIAALLRLSCSKTAASDYALIILAASLGRYRACKGAGQCIKCPRTALSIARLPF
jgi:hypothetical protein